MKDSIFDKGKFFLKLCGTILLVTLLIFMLLSGTKFSRQIEKQSINNAAQNYLEKRQFNEIRFGMHSLMNPLMNIQFPAIKFIKVERDIVCQKETDGHKEYRIEGVLLSYWGISSPLYVHYNCGTIAWGKLLKSH